MSNANVVNLPVKARLRCQECGAPGEGSCHCGAPYVSAGKYSGVAVKEPENHNKTNRALAAELGVDHKTVGAARKAGGEYSPPEPERRTGKDGKSYPARQPRKPCTDIRPGSLDYAQKHMKGIMRVFKESLSKEDWLELVRWMKEQSKW